MLPLMLNLYVSRLKEAGRRFALAVVGGLSNDRAAAGGARRGERSLRSLPPEDASPRSRQ